MDLEDFIVAMFVRIDDAVQAWRAAGGVLRTRGPQPILADSEVLTMETVGEFLGIDRDAELVRYFRAHHRPLFPNIARVHRTTFARQAANLWALKQVLQPRLLAQIPHDDACWLIDSAPIPLCRFAHAPRLRRLRECGGFGWDASSGALFFGLRLHARICAPGVLAAVELAPANAPDAALAPELTAGATGAVIGDRAYWDPMLRDELALAGLELRAPFRKRARDPDPAASRRLNDQRRRIETCFSQLVDRYHLKRVWARDRWHATSRLARKVLSHTLAVLLNVDQGSAHPGQLARLLP